MERIGQVLLKDIILVTLSSFESPLYDFFSRKVLILEYLLPSFYHLFSWKLMILNKFLSPFPDLPNMTHLPSINILLWVHPPVLFYNLAKLKQFIDRGSLLLFMFQHQFQNFEELDTSGDIDHSLSNLTQCVDDSFIHKRLVFSFFDRVQNYVMIFSQS